MKILFGMPSLPFSNVKKHKSSGDKSHPGPEDLHLSDVLNLSGGIKNQARGWKTLPHYQRQPRPGFEFLPPKKLSMSEAEIFFDLNGPTTLEDARRLVDMTYMRAQKHTWWERDAKREAIVDKVLVFSRDFRLDDFPSFGSLPNKYWFRSGNKKISPSQIHFLGDFDISGCQKLFSIHNDVYVEGSFLARNVGAFEIGEDVEDPWSLAPTFPHHFEVGSGVEMTGYLGKIDGYFPRVWLSQREGILSKGSLSFASPFYTQRIERNV